MSRKFRFNQALWLVVYMAAMSSFDMQADSALLVKAAYWLYKPGSNLSLTRAGDFTHLFFASATLDPSTFNVLPPPGGAAAAAALQAFPSAARASNPSVKAILSVSGNTSAFSAMAASPAYRLAFINSSIVLAHTLSFDGLDLDWEFPASDTDMANFASLVSEWRAACVSSNFSTPLLLTAVVRYNITVMSTSGAMATYPWGCNTNVPLLASNGSAPITPATYPVQAIARNLDWVNIKAFDYHGAWEPTRTGEHTALFDANPYQMASTDYGIRRWLAAGLPPVQAVMGLAMYGRTWLLQDPMQNIVGAPAVSAGPCGGIYTYDEIKEFVNSSKAYCRDDVVTKAAFCYGKLSKGASGNGVLWVGYDNARTIATKVRYLKAKKLGGYFLWSLGFDKNSDLSKQGVEENDKGQGGDTS